MVYELFFNLLYAFGSFVEGSSRSYFPIAAISFWAGKKVFVFDLILLLILC